MKHDETSYCDIHKDDRRFVGHSTIKGVIVEIYADEHTPNCRFYKDTGKRMKENR